MGVAAVVLAAGGGTRFHGPRPKLLTPVDGEPLVVHAVRAALGAELATTFVVWGAVPLDEALDAAGLGDRVTLVEHAGWADGQATSLAAALAAADAAGHDSVVVGLGDQPGIGAEAWRAVAEARSDTPIVVATYAGQRRNPVRLDRVVWPELPTTGDQGARVLFERRPELVSEVACPGKPEDIDTLEDLERWS